MQTQANIPVATLPRPNPGKWYITPDKMHYSQMNVTSRVACTGDETMQYGAEAPTECAVWEIHANTTVYKILLSPSGACTLVPLFKLLWYEILIQSKIRENMPNLSLHTDSEVNHKNVLHSLFYKCPIITKTAKAQYTNVFKTVVAAHYA